jgi:hypothetical protein
LQQGNQDAAGFASGDRDQSRQHCPNLWVAVSQLKDGTCPRGHAFPPSAVLLVIGLRLEEEAEARRDPWKAPAVALRQMRQELNDIHAQRDAAGRDLNYEAEALQYCREHPGFPEIYHGYWQSEYASLKLQNPRATHEQLVQR